MSRRRKRESLTADTPTASDGDERDDESGDRRAAENNNNHGGLATLCSLSNEINDHHGAASFLAFLLCLLPALTCSDRSFSFSERF